MLVARLLELGGVPADRAELMLAALTALAALADVREAVSKSNNIDSIANLLSGGHFVSWPPVQIHVHEEAATGGMTVQFDAGAYEPGRTDTERMRCVAAVSEPDDRNTTTIPPRIRRNSAVSAVSRRT